MSNEWILFLAPPAGLAANGIIQILSAHVLRRFAASVVIGAFAGLLTASVIVLRYHASQSPADWAVALLTYCALAFGFWAFLNLNISSLRIRILREILHQQGTLTLSELMVRYSAEEFFSRRMQRLETGSRQLSHRDGRWRLKSRTLYAAAQILSFLRALMLPSG